MTPPETLRVWGEAAIGAAFWTCLLWPALVAWFWPWHRSEWGWNMVIKTELIAAALLSSVLKLEFGVESRLALLWVTVLAVTAIPLVIGWRTWIIWRGQRDGAERDRQLTCRFETEKPPGNRGPFRVPAADGASSAGE